MSSGSGGDAQHFLETQIRTNALRMGLKLLPQPQVSQQPPSQHPQQPLRNFIRFRRFFKLKLELDAATANTGDSSGSVHDPAPLAPSDCWTLRHTLFDPLLHIPLRQPLEETTTSTATTTGVDSINFLNNNNNINANGPSPPHTVPQTTSFGLGAQSPNTPNIINNTPHNLTNTASNTLFTPFTMVDDSSPPPRQDLLFHQPPHQQTSTAATEAATNAASDTGSSSFIQPNFPGSVWELWIFELNNTFTPPPSTCTAGLDPLSWIQFASYGNGNHGNHTDLLGESTVDGEIVGSEGEHGGPSTSSLFIEMQGGEVYLDRLYYASSGGGGSDIIKPTSEYLLLLDALRNLIERSMCRKGWLRLGNIYVESPIFQQQGIRHQQHLDSSGMLLDIPRLQPSPSSSSLQSPLPGMTFDVSLTASSQLIIQCAGVMVPPRLRHINQFDLDFTNACTSQSSSSSTPLKVLLAPHGIEAVLLPFGNSSDPNANVNARRDPFYISRKDEEVCLQAWESWLGVKFKRRDLSSSSMSDSVYVYIPPSSLASSPSFSSLSSSSPSLLSLIGNSSVATSFMTSSPGTTSPSANVGSGLLLLYPTCLIFCIMQLPQASCYPLLPPTQPNNAIISSYPPLPSMSFLSNRSPSISSSTFSSAFYGSWILAEADPEDDYTIDLFLGRSSLPSAPTATTSSSPPRQGRTSPIKRFVEKDHKASHSSSSSSPSTSPHPHHHWRRRRQLLPHPLRRRKVKIDEFTYTSSLLQNLGSGELIVKKYQQQQQLQQQSAMLMWNTSGLGKSCGEFGLHGVEEELIVEEEEVMASGKSTGSMSQQPAHQYQKPYDSKLKKILKEKSNSSPATAAILMDDAANTHTAPMINNPSNRSNNNPVLGSSGDLLMGDFLDSSLNGGGNGGSSSRAVGGIGGGGGDSFYNTDDLKGLEIDAVDDDDFSFFDSGDILGGGASKQIATTMSSSSAPVAAGVGSVTSTNSETSASAAIAQFTSSNSSPSYPIDMGLSPAAIAVASVSATSTNPLPNASSSSSSTKQQQQQPQQRFNHQVMNNNNAMFGISPSPLAMSPLPTHSASFTPFASAATPAAVTPFYSGVPTPMGPLSPAAAAADNQDEPLPSITETSLETIVVATATSLSSVAAATSTSSVTAITATEFNLNGNAWCGVSKATRRFLLPSQIIEDDLDAFRSINLLPKKWVPFQFPLDNTVSHQLDANIDVSGALKMRHPLAHLVKKYGKRGRWSYSLSSSTSSSIPSSTKSNTGNVSRGLTGKRKADSDHVSGDIHPPPLKKSVTSAPSSSESSSSSSSPNSSSSSTQDDLNIRSKPSSASHCSKTTAATITTSPSFLKNHTVSPPPASIPPIRILSIENSAIFSMILSSSSSLLMSASSLRKTSSFSSFLDCLAPYSSFKVFTDQASECIQRYSSSSTAGISFSSPSSALLPSSVSSSPTTNILDIVFERKKMLDSPALSYKRRMVDELAIYLVLQGSVYSLKFDLYADTQEKESDCENLESDALFRDLKSLEVVRAIMEETVCRGNIATTAATTPDATTPGVYTAVGSADMTGSPDVISGASASGGADQSSLPIQLKGPLTLQQFFDSQDNERMVSKYGKFQLKKKKKATDMALDYLAVPDILVMCDASMIQVSASIMRFWEKMRLAPIGGKKRAYYTVITPTHLVDSKSSVSRQISDEVSLWFTEVACLFDLCGLGAMIDVNDGVSVNGHISVNVSNESSNLPAPAHVIQCYYQAIRQYIPSLCSMWFDMQNDEFFVIYLVDLFTNQFPFEMSYLCSTFLYELAENIVTSSLTDGFHHKDSVDIPLSLDQVLHQVKQKIILDTIPVELIRDVSLGDSYMNIKKALCFLLYSRCRPCVSIDETVNSRSESTQIDLRLVVPSSTSLLHLDTIKPVSEITFLHSSIFSLAPPNLQPPLFSMTQPYESSYQLTCEPDRLLHIIYEVVKDWICVCWCDGRGEMIELTAFRFSASSDSALDSRRVSFCKIWARTLELIGVYGFGWRLVFAKRGELSAYEIQDWTIGAFKEFLDKHQNRSASPFSAISSRSTPSSFHHKYDFTSSIFSISLVCIQKSSLTKFFDTRISSASTLSVAGTPIASGFELEESHNNNNSSMNANAFHAAAGSAASPGANIMSLDNAADDKLVANIPLSYLVLQMNHQTPIQNTLSTTSNNSTGANAEWLPLASGWIVEINRKNASSASTETTAENHRSCRGLSVGLAWHFHNSLTESMRTLFSTWIPSASSIYGGGGNTSLGARSSTTHQTTSPSTCAQPHHTNVMRDVIKQYHSMRYLGPPSWSNNSSSRTSRSSSPSSSSSSTSASSVSILPYPCQLTRSACANLENVSL